MIFTFDAFELDIPRRELRRGGVPVPIEPQVFALLHLLVEERDRALSKDEIIDRIWSRASHIRCGTEQPDQIRPAGAGR